MPASARLAWPPPPSLRTQSGGKRSLQAAGGRPSRAVTGSAAAAAPRAQPAHGPSSRHGGARASEQAREPAADERPARACPAKNREAASERPGLFCPGCNPRWARREGGRRHDRATLGILTQRSKPHLQPRRSRGSPPPCSRQGRCAGSMGTAGEAVIWFSKNKIKSYTSSHGTQEGLASE